MSMVTRCPSCATLFRVTPQQLQARSGQVRCGRCMLVFDGFKALATLPERAVPEPTVQLVPEAGAPAVDEHHVAGALLEFAERPGAVESPESVMAAAVATAPPDTPEAVAPIEAIEAIEPLEAATPAPPVRPHDAVRRERQLVDREPEDAVDRAARSQGGRRWSAGAALLLLALAGQAAYAYRVELAANYPAARPLLSAFCDLIGCAIPLPQRPQLINIEASDLQVQDPARPAVIQLTATLRNHAAYAVGYPALDLVLTNTKEHTLARRIVLPAEYLGTERDAAAGLPAHAEITVRVILDTGDLGPAGFRLALLAAR